MDAFFESFSDSLKKQYPKTFESFGGTPPLSPYQVSPAILDLPKALKKTIEGGVRAFWETARSIYPASELRPELGVCTSFDFHVNSGQAKLIEVNTNASLSLIFHTLEEMQNLHDPHFLDKLLDSFQKDHQLRSESDEIPHIAIVDENVEQQKMRIEFYLFKELFEKRGWTAQVVDLKDLRWNDKNQTLSAGGETFNFVYNRHTDFYFSRPESEPLRAAYESGKITITPNPSNYRQLADKSVLYDLTSQDDLAGPLEEILLKAYKVSDLDPQELWSRRKEFFFKPIRSHGSKGVYKGKSISRKVFDHILSHEYIAQELFAPAHTLVNEQDFKYDVRIITYGPNLQIAGARLYQGQLTNFGTLGGGAAPIRWL